MKMNNNENKACKNCGITFEQAHISYDGYLAPRIVERCIKTRERCEYEVDSCVACYLHGGHVKELYGTGRHRWK